jgi:DivIVA domain-containing protein
VLFVAAAVATREGPILADAPVDVADVELPDGPLQPEDLRAVRFALAVRGYRMDEVDRVIERAASELAQRDERILLLEKAKTGPVSVIAPAATVVLSKPPVPAAADLPDEDEPAAPVQPDEPDEPVVPIEPPLETPPPPPEPEPELDTDAESEPDSGVDDQGVSVVADEASPSEDDSESPATSEVDSDEPPPPPPIEVAVVPTEVAPVPATAAMPVADAEDSAHQDLSAGDAEPAVAEGSPDQHGEERPT